MDEYGSGHMAAPDEGLIVEPETWTPKHPPIGVSLLPGTVRIGGKILPILPLTIKRFEALLPLSERIRESKDPAATFMLTMELIKIATAKNRWQRFRLRKLYQKVEYQEALIAFNQIMNHWLPAHAGDQGRKEKD